MTQGPEPRKEFQYFKLFGTEDIRAENRKKLKISELRIG
jgi:hypothetical protein